MLVSILKGLCWIGYVVCGIALLCYLCSYLKVKKQIREDRKEERRDYRK